MEDTSHGAYSFTKVPTYSDKPRGNIAMKLWNDPNDSYYMCGMLCLAPYTALGTVGAIMIWGWLAVLPGLLAYALIYLSIMEKR